jgi:hypothetical protein
MMTKTLSAVVASLGLTACLTATAGTIVIDVTSAGASGNGVDVNGADFNYANPQPTGTGYIDPFLREQVVNSGIEAGVNTSIPAHIMDDYMGTGNLPGVFWDNKPPVNYTHDLAISSLTSVNGNYRFFLDANQVANGPISLTTFKLFVSSKEYTSAAALNHFLSTATPAFDMNGGSTQYRIDIASDSGSGSGDMYVDVPTTGIAGNNYLYMVAIFGESGYVANAGFEEWWTRESTPPPSVPDGSSTLVLLGSALSGLGLIRRKLSA